MAYDITHLKNDLEGMIHGTTLDQIQNLDSLIDRASRQILIDVDPQETKRILSFPNPIFDGVFDYPCPSDLKGNKVIDIRPQVARNPQDIYSQSYNRTFDVTKQFTQSPEFTINFNTAIKTIRMASPQLIGGIVINQANTLASDGTWNTGGNATGLSADNINFIAGGSSLQFNLSSDSGSSTGYLENNTMTSVDLSTDEDQSTLFLYTYLPTASQFTSVKLTWGTNSSNYWERSTSITQQGTVFQDGWNLLQYNWLNSTVVGTPDSSNIQYLKITWTYDGTQQTAVRLNNIESRLGSILQIEYYSKYFFRDLLTGAFQETVTDDSNLINLDTETYNLLTYQVALLAVQQQSGAEGTFDVAFFRDAYSNNLKQYKALYKSEITKPQDTYYQMPRPNYRRWFGNRP